MLLKHVRSVLCHNIQEGEVIFKKNSTLSLPKVYRLIDSAISKRQGDQRKHSFLEKKKKTPKKGEWTHYEHPEISYHLMNRFEAIDYEATDYKAIDSSVSQNVFLYLKMFSKQSRKNIIVEDNKK